MKYGWLIVALSLAMFLFGVACNDSDTSSAQQSQSLAGNSGDSDAESDTDEVDSGKDASSKRCRKIRLWPVEKPDITAGGSVVEIDQHGFFVVNGVKFFPYGFYGYPDDQEEMNEYTQAGFNMSVYYGGCCQDTTLASQISKLEFLAANGIWAAPHGFSPQTQIYTESTSTLTDWLAQRDAIGNILFWYTYHEPGIKSKDPQEVNDHYNMVKTIDPDHPNALVMAPGEDFSNYIESTDFMMADPYPAPLQPLAWVKYVMLEVWDADPDKRPYGVGQAFDWYDTWGTSPEGHVWRPWGWEMRNMTYQMLVFGVNAITYFQYSAVHNQHDRWEDLKQVAAEVTELMPIALEPESDIPILELTELENVDHSLREHNGIYYLLVVSTWTNDVKVSYDISALGAELCAINYFSEEQYEVAPDGTIEVALPRYGEAVIQIIP
jgi:hypothetical protein